MCANQRCAKCSKRLTDHDLEIFNRVCSGFLTMDQYEQVLNVVADVDRFWSAEGALCPPCLTLTMAEAV